MGAWRNTTTLLYIYNVVLKHRNTFTFTCTYVHPVGASLFPTGFACSVSPFRPLPRTPERATVPHSDHAFLVAALVQVMLPSRGGPGKGLAIDFGVPLPTLTAGRGWCWLECGVGRLLGRLHHQWLFSVLFLAAVTTMGRGQC